MKNQKSDMLAKCFYAMHPACVLFYYVGLFVLLFLCAHPVFLFAALLGATALLFFYGGTAPKAFVVIALVAMLINPLTNHRGAHILFYLFDNPITLEAAVGGAFSAALICAMLMLFTSMNRLLGSERFLFLCSKCMPKLGFVLYMILRFKDVFALRAKELALTHARSVPPGRYLARVTASVAHYGMLLKTLCAWCLEHGLLTAAALKVAAYGSRARTSFERYKFTCAHGVFTGTAIALFAAIIALFSLGAGRYAIYPRLLAPRLGTLDALALAAVMLYILLPFLSEALAYITRRVRYGFN